MLENSCKHECNESKANFSLTSSLWKIINYNTLEKLKPLLPKRDAANLPLVDSVMKQKIPSIYKLQLDMMCNKTEILQGHEERKNLFTFLLTFQISLSRARSTRDAVLYSSVSET